MHIVVAGPGALGCLLASILIKGNSGGADTISLLDYHQDRANLINRKGLQYKKEQIENILPVQVFTRPEQIDMADAVFLCVKSYDIEETLKFCTPLLRRGTLLIFMQNGIAHLQHRDKVGQAMPTYGTTTEGATALGPGQVRHAGVGVTYLGFLHPQDPRYNVILGKIVDRLAKGGMKTSISHSIYQRLWTKLFINVGINALTVIHNCRNGDLLNITEARNQMKSAIAEAEAVAEAEQVTRITPLQQTIDVCRATAENVSSMLQDIRNKRKTEIDAINGAIEHMAEKHGIATPINSFLVDRVKEIEKG